MGHWKAECPTRQEASGDNRPQASASFVQVQDSHDGLLLEFINWPAFQGTMDEALHNMGYCFTCHGEGDDNLKPKSRLKQALMTWHKTKGSCSNHDMPRSEDRTESAKTRLRQSLAAHSASDGVRPSEAWPTSSFLPRTTYSSMGVVDLGATKTVIGSQLVQG